MWSYASSNFLAWDIHINFYCRNFTVQVFTFTDIKQLEVSWFRFGGFFGGGGKDVVIALGGFFVCENRKTRKIELFSMKSSEKVLMTSSTTPKQFLTDTCLLYSSPSPLMGTTQPFRKCLAVLTILIAEKLILTYKNLKFSCCSCHPFLSHTGNMEIDVVPSSLTFEDCYYVCSQWGPIKKKPKN